MVLNNVSLVNTRLPLNISVKGEKIAAIGVGQAHPDEFQIHFTDTLAIPGLINSHDHLDLNCFTPLGTNIYNNYTEWGKNIHATFKENIRAVMKIPQELRTEWGMYKNLISGITTVVNHGAYLKINNPLIRVYQDSQNLHSVEFEKNWKWKLNNPLMKSRICVMHTGEGSDRKSEIEIDELIKFNLIKRHLIGIHAVAMNRQQAKKFKGIVWCPESNKILLNKQPDIQALKENTTIVFGTDSTLTGDWNIWHHLRFAKSLGLVNDEELFKMLTSLPAKLWNMNSGSLHPQKDADIVLIRNNKDNWNEFYQTNPEDILMIVQKGKIRLFDKSILPQLTNTGIDYSHYSPIDIHGSVKYIEGNLNSLVRSIQQYNPDVHFPFENF